VSVPTTAPELVTSSAESSTVNEQSGCDAAIAASSGSLGAPFVVAVCGGQPEAAAALGQALLCDEGLAVARGTLGEPFLQALCGSPTGSSSISTDE
jgi:hypothetical protein